MQSRKDSMNRLQAPCVKTSRQSFETDSTNQSFFIQIFFACTSYGISSLSPKAKEKKEVCKTVCDGKERTVALESTPCSTFVIASCCPLPGDVLPT